MSLKSSFLKFKNISAVKRVDVAQKVKAEKLSRQSRQPICQGSNAVKLKTSIKNFFFEIFEISTFDNNFGGEFL